MTNSVFLICNYSKTWNVLQLWCWLAQKYISHVLVHILLKNICTKTSIVVNISRLANLDCVPRWLTNPNSYASISSAVSSIHLVMVPAKRGTCATFQTAVSSKSSWQVSLAASRINSSPIVKGFLAFIMQLATENDALSADTFDEVVSFNNCFWLLCSCFFIFKNSKGLSSNAGCLVSKWQSSFESFMALLDSQSPHIIQSGLGECESPVATDL